MSDVEFENMAILSFTLFSDFSSLFLQLSCGRWRPSVADLNGGFVSTKFVISSKWCVLRCGATIAVAFVIIGVVDDDDVIGVGENLFDSVFSLIYRSCWTK